MSENVDLSTLTAAQLKAELQRREKEEKAAADKAKKDYQKSNDEFVMATVEKFKQAHDTLKQLKDTTILKANQLYEMMFDLEGKEPKEVKSFSRVSENGLFKITVDRQERFVFTDEAEVHIQSIQEILKKTFEGRNKGLFNFINSILMKGSKGEYDPKLLAKGRKQVKELGHEELMYHFDKLQDCLRVVGSSLYCRAYEKVNGKWEDVVIQFSSL